MISIGQNIYLWRGFRGLSQKELSASGNIPRPNLSAIEAGKREPSLPTLRQIAAALDVDIGMLANGTAPSNFNDCVSSKSVQERIVRASLGGKVSGLSTRQKALSLMLANVARAKINVYQYRFSGNLLKNKSYVRDWLVLKAGLRPALLHKLLSHLEKYVAYGTKAN